jgi:hypothetical protein
MDCGVMVSHAVPVLVYRSPGPVIGRDHSTVREGSPRLLIASCPVVATADVYSKSVTVVVKKKNVAHGPGRGRSKLPSSKRVTVVH